MALREPMNLTLVEMDETPFRHHSKHLVQDYAADKVGQWGAKRVEPHVFGHNRGARALYEKPGYAQMSIVMAKPVSD